MRQLENLLERKGKKMTTPTSKAKLDGLAANLLGRFDKLRKQEPTPSPSTTNASTSSGIFNNLSISFNKNRDEKVEQQLPQETPTSLVVIDDEEFDDPSLPDSPSVGDYKSLESNASYGQGFSNYLEKQVSHPNGSVSDYNISQKPREGMQF